MEDSPLYVLTKAANFVENQGQHPGSNSPNVNQNLQQNNTPEKKTNPASKRPPVYQPEAVNIPPERTSQPPYHTNQSSAKRDERPRDTGSSMRMYSLSDAEKHNQQAASMTHFQSNGTLHHRQHTDDRQSTFRRDHSPESPPPRCESPVVRSPPTNEQRTSMPGSLGAIGAHALPNLPAANPMMSLMNPLLYTFDPTMQEALARQRLLQAETHQQSPVSSPSTSSASLHPPVAGAIPGAGFMYPLANPAMFMGHRGAPHLGLSDISMLFPSPLTAYGAAANILPQQVAASLEPDKRMFDTMQGLAHPAALLSNPYMKTFTSAGLDAAAKDTQARLKPSPGVAGMPGYSHEFLQKYQEALTESLKLEHQHAVSPGNRRASPDATVKKMPAYVLPSFLPAAATKSPAPDPKTSPNAPRLVRNGTSASPSIHHHHSSRTSRDNDEESWPINGEDAGRRLMSLAQRPQHASSESIQSRYKTEHRATNSPLERRNYRRVSHDRSPRPNVHPIPAERKKTRDLAFPPAVRDRQPAAHPDNVIHSALSYASKSPKPPKRLGSPGPDVRHHVTSSSSPFVTVKPTPTTQENDIPPYFPPSTAPYMFPGALGGLPPYSLQSYLRHAAPGASPPGKTPAEALAASSLAAGVPLYRPPAPTTEAMLEYARLTGIPPYAVALLMPQQQTYRPSVISHPSTTPQQDYAAAFKQVALQNMVLERAENKYRVGSPALRIPNSSATVKHPDIKTQAPPKPYTPRKPPLEHSEEALDFRPMMKREAVSPPNRSAPASVLLPPRSSHLAPRYPGEEERKLKRKSEDSIPGGENLKKRREVTTESADIDEHFRRSLGEKYKDAQHKVSISGKVDDHFNKALGDAVWRKVKNTGGKSPTDNHNPPHPDDDPSRPYNPRLPPFPASSPARPFHSLPFVQRAQPPQSSAIKALNARAYPDTLGLGHPASVSSHQNNNSLKQSARTSPNLRNTSPYLAAYADDAKAAAGSNGVVRSPAPSHYPVTSPRATVTSSSSENDVRPPATPPTSNPPPYNLSSGNLYADARRSPHFPAAESNGKVPVSAATNLEPGGDVIAPASMPT